MPPSPISPAVAGPILPPIANDAIVDERGHLTLAGLNLFQQIWAGAFGSGGLIDQVAPPGTIVAFGGAIVPAGWLLCDHAAYQIVDQPTLYNAIGTTWGTAGVGTFRVPDGQNKSLLGASGARPLGTSGGAFSQTLTQANLPNVSLPVTDPGHTHTVTDPGHTHGITDPGHHHSGGSSPTNTNTAGAAAGTSSAANTGNANTGITINPANTGITNQAAPTGVTVNTGGTGAAVDTTPPYFAGNWIIKA